MRYTSAVLLSTLAVGQAAALNHRHASFHERRQAEAKRDIQDVDWSKVAYDLSSVNWSTVKYNIPGQSTPSPAPQPSAAAAQPSSKPAPAPAASSAPAVQAQAVPNTASTLINDITQGVSAIAGKLNIKAGTNSNSNNGGIWIGSDSQWKATFQNQGNGDVVLACWLSASDSNPFVMTYAPEILAGIPQGKSLVLSWAGNTPTACAPVWSDTTMALSGYIFQTWIEMNFPGGGGTGAFDISRNPNMNGRSISAQGSQCKADMNTCSFTCTGGASSCMTGYQLNNCDASNGGGGGFNQKAQGIGGGCTMNQSAENLQVILS